MTRLINVVRMQLINRLTFIWVPLIVLAGTVLITLAIYALLDSLGVQGPFFGGGAQAPLWYFAVVGVQALTRSFPFSQAMSVTRREFHLGTLLTAALTSALLSVVFVIGGVVEQALNGWGLNGYLFKLPWLWADGPLAAGFIFFTIAMLFFSIGYAGATLFKRFGQAALMTVLLGILLALVGAVWVITRLNAWVSVWRTILELGAVGLAGWGLVAVAVMAACSYLTLRRAVP